MPLSACSFCDSFVKPEPLRKQIGDAGIVLYGTLRNPKANPDGGGTTEFHLLENIKRDPKFTPAAMIVLPRYIPVIGQTSPEFLLLCHITDGKFDPYGGTSVTPGTIDYIREALKLDAKETAKNLSFFFKHLESPDEATAKDAFLEFALAGDKDILAAKASYDRTKLRTWIADPKVPTERVGVYALLLGLSGNADDANWLAKELAKLPRSERYIANLGGLYTSLALLNADAGWTMIRETIADKATPAAEFYSAYQSIRFFQATQPKQTRERILKVTAVMLQKRDWSDLAIEDLRRWEWWDQTKEILALFDKPENKAPIMRRHIVRYALCCPDAECKAFVEKVRNDDPKLVARVEDGLKGK